MQASEDVSVRSNLIRAGRALIRLADGIVDLAVLACLLMMLAVGVYAIWDTNQLYAEAEGNQYELYKPREEGGPSFAELQAMNPEVFGWITIYGTNIDYPLLQGPDNQKYVNTDVMGEYSTSGALFLDHRNQKDLSDFNHIIYGHHMEKQKMFGELGNCVEQSYFEEHRYGTIYADGKMQGVEYVAFLEANAFDTTLYTPAVTDRARQEELLRYIEEHALHMREVSWGTEDRLLLLSTCTSDILNGRHILVGRLLDHIEEDPFAQGG